MSDSSQFKCKNCLYVSKTDMNLFLMTEAYVPGVRMQNMLEIK